MGKRSDFKRLARDAYDTPREAVLPLLPHLEPGTNFVEPCAGRGELVRHLEDAGHFCRVAYDIEPRADTVLRRDMQLLTMQDMLHAGWVITNPPWKRPLLHALIERLRNLKVNAWLLFDANWVFTAQAVPFLPYCEMVVTIGRVIWIPGTSMTGKDDCAWFLFRPEAVEQTVFVGKRGDRK